MVVISSQSQFASEEGARSNKKWTPPSDIPKLGTFEDPADYFDANDTTAAGNSMLRLGDPSLRHRADATYDLSRVKLSQQEFILPPSRAPLSPPTPEPLTTASSPAPQPRDEVAPIVAPAYRQSQEPYLEEVDDRSQDQEIFSPEKDQFSDYNPILDLDDNNYRIDEQRESGAPLYGNSENEDLQEINEINSDAYDDFDRRNPPPSAPTRRLDQPSSQAARRQRRAPRLIQQQDDANRYEPPLPPQQYDIDVSDLETVDYRQEIQPVVDEPERHWHEDEDMAEMVVDNAEADRLFASEDEDDSENDNIEYDSDASDSDAQLTSEIEEIEIPSTLAIDNQAKTGPRRSTRNRIPTVDTWRGEYVEYTYDEATGTRTATSVHLIEDKEEHERPTKRPRRSPVTALTTADDFAENGESPNNENAPEDELFARSLDPKDNVMEALELSPLVYISTIYPSDENNPCLVAQITMLRGGIIDTRSSGEHWYTFIVMTGSVKASNGDNSVILRRNATALIPPKNWFSVENYGGRDATLVLIQARWEPKQDGNTTVLHNSVDRLFPDLEKEERVRPSASILGELGIGLSSPTRSSTTHHFSPPMTYPD